MVYVKTQWVSAQEPAIDAPNLNKIEVGISDAHEHMEDADIHISDDAQIIDGVKTFSDSPVIPEPTDDMEAATKKYVDDSIPDVPVQSVNSESGDIVLTQDDINDGDTFGQYSLVERSKLSGIEDNATADQSAAEIKIAYESNVNTNVFTDIEKSKLSGIEAAADKTDLENIEAAGAVLRTQNQTIDGIKTFVEFPVLPEEDPTTDYQAANKQYVDARAGSSGPVSSVNTKRGDVTLNQDDIHDGVTYRQYSAVEKLKLAGIADDATADMTANEIKVAYESNTDTNAFTDDEKSKLSSVEDAADVTSAIKVKNVGAVMINGNQEIAGTKTFTSIPELPHDMPTTENQAVRKGYIDGLTQDDIPDGVYNKQFCSDEQLKLSGIESGATADQSASEIKIAYESNADTNAFDDAAVSKLGGIEAGATADMSASEIKIAYESNADTNGFNDAAVSKLGGIEDNATADMSASEIKIAYESNVNTNAFTDIEKSKLTGIEAAADVTDATNVANAGAVMNSGNETINGIKTFGSFPVTPSSAPTAAYEVANKKYVDDNLTAGAVYTTGDQSVDGVKTFVKSPLIPTPTTDMQAATKKYVDDSIVDYVDDLGLPDGESLQEAVSYVDSMKMQAIIGVEWDSSSDSPTLRRIDYAGNTITTTPATFDNHVIWGFMRRCSYDGYEISYGTNARGDGLKLNGSDDIFVEIPRFYVKVEREGTLYRWWVSPTPLSGFELHPAFKQHSINGEYYNYLYIAAYEASGFWHTDNSTMDLISRSGKRPITGQCGFPNLPGDSLTPTQAATYARNASQHYKLINVWVRSAPTLLFMIEYATLNAQTALGYGIMYKPWTGGFNGEYTGAHSADSNIGTNGTGTGTGTDCLTPIVYRGIENWWGNVTEFEPGLTMTTAYTWIPAPDDATATISIGDMITGDGYGERFNNTKYGMMALVPAGNGGKTSNTCLCDWNYYPRNDDGGARVGGMFSDGDGSGPHNHAVWATGNSLYQGCRFHYLGD